MIALPQPPLPAPMPAIVRAPCPWRALETAGCFYPRGVDGAGAPVIYLGATFAALAAASPREQRRADLWVKEHELGHAFDAQRVSAGERLAIEKTARWGGWHAEDFADEYASCRLDVRPPSSRWVPSAYGALRSARRVAALCAQIARAYWR